MRDYDPANWFWILGGDESRAWSSAAGDYVAEWPADRVTRIASEQELSNVLRPYGLVLPAPVQDDYKNAVQAKIDLTARGRNYADGVSLASYENDPFGRWAAEAAAFKAWRSTVWLYVYAQLAAVTSGDREQPTIDGLLSELPSIEWPEP